MNELKIEGESAADIRLQTFSLIDDVGSYRLILNLEIGPQGKSARGLDLRGVRGHVRLGTWRDHGKYVGEAHLDDSQIHLSSYGSSTTATVYVRLQEYQLQKLHETVSGDNFSLSVQLWAQAIDPESPESAPKSAEAELSFRDLAQSDWAQEIKRCGFAEILLLQVELPAQEASNGLSEAVEELKIAKAEYDDGEYTHTVNHCRKVIESIQDALEEKERVKQAIDAYKEKESREAMTITQRELLAEEMARNLAHPAHHSGEERYNRRQAALQLRLTTAFLSSAIGRSQE